MKRIAALLLFALPLMGCNVAATTMKGTGAFIQAGPITIIAGSFDGSHTAGEFADEQLTIEHETYYDANISTSANSNTGVTQGMKSAYKVRLTPVKPAERPDATPVTPEEEPDGT